MGETLRPSMLSDDEARKKQQSGFRSVFGTGATASFIQNVKAQSESENFDFAAPFVRKEITQYPDHEKVGLIIKEILARQGNLKALYLNDQEAVEAIETFVSKYRDRGSQDFF